MERQLGRSLLRLHSARTRASLANWPALERTALRQVSQRHESSPSVNSERHSRSEWIGVAAGVVGLTLLGSALNITSASNEPRNQPPTEDKSLATDELTKSMISMDEVAKHSTPEQGLWVVIGGNVYDVTDFIDKHPGGRNVILKNAGKDVTAIYEPVHPPTAIDDNLTDSQKLGLVDPKTVKVEQKELTDAEKRRKEALANLPAVGTVLSLDDFERIAKDLLTEQAWAYYSSAGDDEITYYNNRQAFSRIWFRPRVLRKVGEVDTSTRILANTEGASKSKAINVTLPIYISPAAMAKLGHPDGELNLTRAAGANGIMQGISANASVGLDEMLDARQPGQPVFYQLYVNRDRAASERILHKIEEKGVNAVFLTVDAPVMGKREKDMRAKGEAVETGGGVCDKAGEGLGVAAAISGYIDPNVCWEDIAWYRKTCKLPLYLKGIQCVEDAELAAAHGVDGIVLSNHGGRSLEFSPAPIDVLIELQQRKPELFNKLEVFVDGGIRRGTDVLKARALGAKAVGLGRPFLYAQSGFGEAGASRAIQIMVDEVQRGMRLLGVTSLDQLTPDMIDILPRTYHPPPRPAEPHAEL
ncbi:hypothetical protein K437DRAFT_259987 [Tilletiaria anomala UBC 951]|uniref:L-lactate dehydrogenase (cytochrome) n=1 Tax=Tilletiaria anomala (strain ATCC 24038 / CBS 436.72 / UBC 951) TaxID=1037660 RepID=A0A066V9C8_TILAU|nr:uncharacterized protein K437DRAFT_259987 [Tilletiaria anomala UBC 951]KDN36878.1 hypothetical protein K437DRAFT_259987 [Tilletiaria anomala UBC 951]